MCNGLLSSVLYISSVGRGRDLNIGRNVMSYQRYYKVTIVFSETDRKDGSFPFDYKLQFEFDRKFSVLNFPIQNWNPRYAKSWNYLFTKKKLNGIVLFRREKPYRRSICAEKILCSEKKKLSFNLRRELRKNKNFNKSRVHHLCVFFATFYQRSFESSVKIKF